MSEMAPEEIVPTLKVAAQVTEEEYDHLNGTTQSSEVVIEMSLDDEIVLVLAFPNDGPVDREHVGVLLQMALQSYPQILDQMEAQSE